MLGKSLNEVDPNCILEIREHSVLVLVTTSALYVCFLPIFGKSFLDNHLRTA